MPTEVEIRLLDVDVPAVEDRLQRLQQEGATFLSTVLLREVRFAGITGHRGEYLRVRDDGRRIRLQHKVHSGDGFSAAESEIFTEDYDEAVAFFTGMGLRRQFAIERVRTQWALDRAIVSIDQMPRIPPHVEVEAETLEDVLAACARLGLDPKGHLDGGPGEIYQARGVPWQPPDDLVFSAEERRTLPTPRWGVTVTRQEPS